MSVFWMLVSALLFSMMGVFIKLASMQYGTAEILFYRNLIGLIIIWPYMLFRGERIRSRYWSMHLSRGIFGILAMSLWFVAFSLLPLAMAMTLNYTSPVWMALILTFSPLIQRQSIKIDGFLLWAIFISFIGVVCLLQPTVSDHHQWLGGILGLCSGIAAAIAYLTVRQLGQYGESEALTVFYLSLIGVIAGGVWVTLSDLHIHTTEGVGLLIAVGISATLAQLALTRAYRYGNTLLIANCHYMGIVFAALWGILIWHDQLNLLSEIGIILIIASGMLSTFFRVRATRVH